MRCQLIFWRVRGGDFYRDSETALSELWETLESQKITPRHSWESDRKQPERESTTKDRMPASDIAEQYRGDFADNAEEDNQGKEKELEVEEEPESAEIAEGTLDRALDSAVSPSRRSEVMPPLDIQKAILYSLQICPNHSCTLKSLTSRVLKQLKVLTRGNPRLEFEKRVMRNLGELKRKGIVEEYKAKNRRIRLL